MKIRTNYVSNSSSSSFVVTKDYTSSGVACYKIPEDRLQSVSAGLNASLSTDKEWFITRFLTANDEMDGKYDMVTEGEHYVYMDGEMSGNPYMTDEGDYCGVEVPPGVWLYTADAPSVPLSKNKVMQQLPSGCKFLYEVNSDGQIILTPQR